jgi:hypothetical protein
MRSLLLYIVAKEITGKSQLFGASIALERCLGVLLLVATLSHSHLEQAGHRFKQTIRLHHCMAFWIVVQLFVSFHSSRPHSNLYRAAALQASAFPRPTSCRSHFPDVIDGTNWPTKRHAGKYMGPSIYS